MCKLFHRASSGPSIGGEGLRRYNFVDARSPKMDGAQWRAGAGQVCLMAIRSNSFYSNLICTLCYFSTRARPLVPMLSTYWIVRSWPHDYRPGLQRLFQLVFSHRSRLGSLGGACMIYYEKDWVSKEFCCFFRGLFLIADGPNRVILKNGGSSAGAYCAYMSMLKIMTTRYLGNNRLILLIGG